MEVHSAWPNLPGTKLYAHDARVLPPIDAVFAHGSGVIGEWIESLGWERSERYNDNFKGRDIVDKYERLWQQEHPLYLGSDIYAALGGWRFPMPDPDWHDLIDDQLMVFTLRDSEPWIEAWRTRAGDFRVIQRNT